MLALICGRGSLPKKIHDAQKTTPVVCVMDGFEPDGLTADLEFRLETLGSLFLALKKRGVDQICLCGGIDRPQLDPSKLDEPTKILVPIMVQALSEGDDGALRAVMGLFETQGFQIRAAHELLPDLLTPVGLLSAKSPDAQMQADGQKGLALLNALASFDVGQACVVGGGQLIGVETIGGTDFMLSHLPQTSVLGQGVLVKAPKTGQDLRADMPTIGPETIRAVAQAGLAGIVIDARAVMMLEPAQCIALADQFGLVLYAQEGA